MKKVGLLFLFLILLSIGVLAVKPVNTVILPEAGLLLTVNSYNVYPTNTNLELFVHVFNDSNGLRLWNRTGMGVSCDNDVYLPNGSIYVEQTGVWDGNELKLSLSGVATPGTYSYEVYCNTSKRGGELLNYFEVTTTGEETPLSLQLENNDIFLIIIFIVQFFIISFFILLGLPHKVGFVKIVCWGIALLESLMTVWFVYIQNLGGDLSPFIYINAITSLLIGGGFGIYTLIILMLKMMNPANSSPVEEDSYTKFVHKHDFNRKFN